MESLSYGGGQAGLIHRQVSVNEVVTWHFRDKRLGITHNSGGLQVQIKVRTWLFTLHKTSDSVAMSIWTLINYPFNFLASNSALDSIKAKSHCILQTNQHHTQIPHNTVFSKVVKLSVDTFYLVCYGTSMKSKSVHVHYLQFLYFNHFYF